MMRYWLRLILIVTGILLLPVLLIRAQTYDSDALTTFLSPADGCHAPCFLGIVPGQTTVEEAVHILQQHEWVADVIESNEFNRIVVVWRPVPHPVIDTDALGRLRFAGGIIDSINIQTHVAFADLWLGYGPPDRAQRNLVGDNRPAGRSYWVWYEEALPVFAFFVPVRPHAEQFRAVIHQPLTFNYGVVGSTRSFADPTLRDF